MLYWKMMTTVFLVLVMMTVHTYANRAIRLVGGKDTIPNKGDVQVWNPDYSQWASVCDSSWSFYDVIVACRELGYPGAALVKKGSYFGSTESNLTVGEFKCNAGESNLTSCEHGSFTHESCPSGLAGAICTAPGYVGCFNDYTFYSTPTLTGQNKTFDNLSVERCIKYCSDSMYMYMYAGVKNGSLCLCGDVVYGHNRRKLYDLGCNMVCAGNEDQTCGGDQEIGIYKVNQGSCKDPGTLHNGNHTLVQATNKRDLYFGTFIEFTCNPGYELDGTARIQCTLAANGDEDVVWSEPMPTCNAVSDVSSDVTSSAPSLQTNGGLSQGTIVGIVVACAMLLILLILLIVLIIRKRRQRVNRNGNKPNDAYSQPQDPTRCQTSHGPQMANTEYQDLTLPSKDIDRPYTSLRKAGPQMQESVVISEYLDLNVVNSVGPNKVHRLLIPEINDTEYAYVDTPQIDRDSKTADLSLGGTKNPDEYAYVDTSQIDRDSKTANQSLGGTENPDEYAYVDTPQIDRDSKTADQSLGGTENPDEYAYIGSMYYSLPPDAH